MNKTTTSLIASSLILGGIGGTLLSGKTEVVDFDSKGQNVKIQVLIKEQNFQDAIYYTPAEWEKLTEKDINVSKLERFNNWKTLIETSSQQIPIEPTKEQIQNEKFQLEQQLEIINSKLNATP